MVLTIAIGVSNEWRVSDLFIYLLIAQCRIIAGRHNYQVGFKLSRKLKRKHTQN